MLHSFTYSRSLYSSACFWKINFLRFFVLLYRTYGLALTKNYWQNFIRLEQQSQSAIYALDPRGDIRSNFLGPESHLFSDRARVRLLFGPGDSVRLPWLTWGKWETGGGRTRGLIMTVWRHSPGQAPYMGQRWWYLRWWHAANHSPALIVML